MTTRKKRSEKASSGEKAHASKKVKADVPIPPEFQLLHRFWQASNYLSVGQVSERTCLVNRLYDIISIIF